MITETTYNQFELQHGRCVSCGETSDEIFIDEDLEENESQCIGCIESDKFYGETMKGI